MEGVHRYTSVVLDMEDKITALAEKNTKESRFALIMRTINSLIGEISNTATCYASKTPKDEATKKKYNEYIDLLSILNGKAMKEHNLWPYTVTYSKKVGELRNLRCQIYA